MHTYFLATKLSPESAVDAKAIKANGKKWLDSVKRNCPDVKWLGHYALFGQYDFISIYQASDVDTAAKVSVISMSLGAQKAESWPAIPYGDFIKMLDVIE